MKGACNDIELHFSHNDETKERDDNIKNLLTHLIPKNAYDVI